MRKEGILGGGRVVKKSCDIDHTKEKRHGYGRTGRVYK